MRYTVQCLPSESLQENFNSKTAEAFKHEKFKTCGQFGFCQRNRALADRESDTSWQSPYNLDSGTLRFDSGQLKGTLWKTLASGASIELPILVSFLESGAARVTVDEAKRIAEDISIPSDKVNKRRYDEAENWTITCGLELSKSAIINPETDHETAGTGFTRILFGQERQFEAIIQHAPFKVDFRIKGRTHVQLNSRGLLNLEHWRPRDHVGEADTDEDQSTWWEETFDGHTDSKPRGPESVGIDVSFPGYTHVFGIPEHADSLSLRETR